MQFNRCCSRQFRWLSLGMKCHAALTALAFVAIAGLPSPALAQAKDPPAKSEKEKGKDALPKMEIIDRETSDNLQLTLSYYAAVDREAIQDGKGKRVIPIVLLHGFKESRNEFKDLALGLQKLGYAVIVPDLRGHGDSTHWIGSSRSEKLEAAKMPPPQFSRMVTEDMKAVKDVLWEKNNAAELNIDKLCIVGTEMGASVALNTAGFDAEGYGSTGAYYGPRKLGRFVKAIVLISPKWTLRGLSISRATKDPVVQSDIALMILVGKQDPKALKEAERIYDTFKRWHLEPTGDDKLDKQTLFLGRLDTKLQGAELLDSAFGVKDLIADFVYRRLVKNDAAREWTWKLRKLPTD
jgi:pimeloyl-ACP methyl ester carboxylesterase